MSALDAYRAALRQATLAPRMGWVRSVNGFALACEGPDARLGEICHVLPRQSTAPAVLAEVVGVAPDHVVLMPYGPVEGIAAGSRVVARGDSGSIGSGAALLGRVVDGFGQPLDGRPAPQRLSAASLRPPAAPVLHRPRIRQVLETGVRAIDGLLTLGQGQRVGIFAGSGVGKSSLLGMVTRQALADVNVIALIGERGREVREFVEEQLGGEGLRRSVVIAATCDQPAPARIRAAHAAVAIAVHFADAGRHVLLTMDSVTRLAMARREVGLAAGEPATARGYTPSVFAELPQLCERCGTSPSGGSVTALFTVLVEGDDLNEPIADAMRSILDGHVVLSRDLAQQGHFPPIDVLRSVSRLLPHLASAEERKLAAAAVSHLSELARHRDLVDLGAYAPGSNPTLDAALAVEPALFAWLRQEPGATPRADALRQLAQLLARGPAP